MPKFRPIKRHAHDVALTISKRLSRLYRRRLDDINYPQFYAELDDMFNRLKRAAPGFVASYMEFRFVVKNEDDFQTVDNFTYRTNLELLKDWGKNLHDLEARFEELLEAPKSGRKSPQFEGDIIVLTKASIIFSRPMTDAEIKSANRSRARRRKKYNEAFEKTVRKKARAKKKKSRKTIRRPGRRVARKKLRKRARAVARTHQKTKKGRKGKIRRV